MQSAQSMWSEQSAQSAQSVWQPSVAAFGEVGVAYEKYCAELNAAEAAERSAQSAHPMQAYLEYFAKRDAETAAAAMGRCPRPG